MRNKNLIRNWLILLALLGIFFGGVKSYWLFFSSPVDPSGKEQPFVVKEGDSWNGVADKLEGQRLIRSALYFKILIKWKNVGGLQAGDYKISSSQTPMQIMETFFQGPVDRWVTLLEGWRLEEMADKLSQKGLVGREEFLKVAKEGYMFPDTYLFSPKEQAVGITGVMRANFNRKYDDSLQSKIRALGLTPEQGVTLASIVEREARSDGARTAVASILLKRLKIGMGLNADATIQYALGYSQQERSWWRKKITMDDFKIVSPYNTYIHSGLPPAPICNPGLASLKAVASADPSTPYLYYYHDSKGDSYYAKTLDEHNQNVANHP